jgi:hypothetical protein
LPFFALSLGSLFERLTARPLPAVAIMLDINDFIAQRGGNPDKIKESQRRRGGSVEVVDQVIKLWDDARAGTIVTRGFFRCSNVDLS